MVLVFCYSLKRKGCNCWVLGWDYGDVIGFQKWVISQLLSLFINLSISYCSLSLTYYCYVLVLVLFELINLGSPIYWAKFNSTPQSPLTNLRVNSSRFGVNLWYFLRCKIWSINPKLQTYKLSHIIQIFSTNHKFHLLS